MSINQLIGLISGALAGFSWEHISNARFNDNKTFLKSIFIGKFHPHHWLIYAVALISVLAWAQKHDKLTHPSVLMIVVFFATSILYGFIFLKGWGNFLK